MLEEIGDPLTISQKNYPSKIGTRTETKVDNGNDNPTEANFIDHFVAEIFFIPIGRFDEMLKAPEPALFRGQSILDCSGLSDRSQGRYGYWNCHKGFHLFGSLESVIGKRRKDL